VSASSASARSAIFLIWLIPLICSVTLDAVRSQPSSLIPLRSMRAMGTCQSSHSGGLAVVSGASGVHSRKNGNSFSSSELNPSNGIEVSEYELRSSNSCSRTLGSGVCSDVGWDRYAESICSQPSSHTSLTSALFNILAHFLTTGSNASRLLEA
jgi:hypothetical protein